MQDYVEQPDGDLPLASLLVVGATVATPVFFLVLLSQVAPGFKTPFAFVDGLLGISAPY